MLHNLVCFFLSDQRVVESQVYRDFTLIFLK